MPLMIYVEKYCTAGQVTDDNIIRRMHIACWITKATNTHPDYVIFTAFSLQQLFQERAPVLSYTYIACLTFTGPCIAIYFFSKSNKMQQLLKFILFLG
jgi:hypothetical protein